MNLCQGEVWKKSREGMRRNTKRISFFKRLINITIYSRERQRVKGYDGRRGILYIYSDLSYTYNKIMLTD